MANRKPTLERRKVVADILKHRGDGNFVHAAVVFVHWRGKHVEHYDISFAFSDKGREAALELAQRCRHLEQKGIEVSMTNVVWRWKKFQ